MELNGSDRALYIHPGIKGWTLRVFRAPRQHDDPPDKPATYVGLIYFGEVFHSRITILSSSEGRSEARAELNRRFEEWVYEYVARPPSRDTEPGQP
jgi:hypothetical protein